MADCNSPISWFSGLCLEGEVTSQYRIEGPAAEEDDSAPAYLELDNLAPITIFVGANNCGKSRLLRELFANLEPVYLRIGSDQKQWRSGASRAGGIVSLDGIKGLIQAACEWRSIKADGLETLRRTKYQILKDWLPSWSFAALANLDRNLASNYPADQRRADREGGIEHGTVQAWRASWQEVVSQVPRAIEYRKLKRCYIPLLRGMRPPGAAKDSQKEGQQSYDCFAQRAVDDYFSHIRSDEPLPASGKPARLFGFQFDADYHHLKHENLSLCSGLGIYSDLQSRLLSPEQARRDSVALFQDFLSREFFGGETVVLVPALKNADGSANDVVYIKIGAESERPIHDLGDGMQSLIICTYPIVTETQPGSLFFLEEPDLCMHPSLQRAFLDVLKSHHREKGHQFFITTHSNHLLDLVDDADLVSIFSFSTICTTEEEAVSQPGSPPRFRIRAAGRSDRELLAQLGVRPSATFLSNATIWVEGVSDASYLRAYMEAFIHYLGLRGGDAWKGTVARLKQYKEDLHYAFVEYSGANLEHYNFEGSEGSSSCDQNSATASLGSPSVPPRNGRRTDATSLCATALVIADGDIADPQSKGDRLDRFSRQLGHRLIVLPGKEIENLIPESLVRQQVHADHGPGRRGNVNEDEVERIHYSEYARSIPDESGMSGLGAYLGETLAISKYSRAGGSGTLPGTYKRDWSSPAQGVPSKIRAALRGMPATEGARVSDADLNQLPAYLTHDLLWLCARIYRHIAECNHHNEASQQLSVFLQALSTMHREYQSSDSCLGSGAEGGHLSPDGWPIQDPNDRRCFFAEVATITTPESASPEKGGESA